MGYDTNVVVAVDFDNTITVGSVYGTTGRISRRSVWWLRKIRRLGCKMVLWTTREGTDLDEAAEMLDSVGLAFDYVNAYPLRGCARKVNADVYIDDKANDGKIRWLRTYLRARRMARKGPSR